MKIPHVLSDSDFTSLMTSVFDLPWPIYQRVSELERRLGVRLGFESAAFALQIYGYISRDSISPQRAIPMLLWMISDRSPGPKRSDYRTMQRNWIIERDFQEMEIVGTFEMTSPSTGEVTI